MYFLKYVKSMPYKSTKFKDNSNKYSMYLLLLLTKVNYM